jgi:Family of unknown function (DUF6492)
VRPFGPELFLMPNGDVRLYALPDEIEMSEAKWSEHQVWTRNAAALLALPAPLFPAPDYIINLVSWRRDHALSLVSHVEKTTGLEFVEAMGRRRTFSEYQLYGAYVEGVLKGAGHQVNTMALSHTYWSGEALTEINFARFVDDMHPAQIAVCVQSFTNTSVDVMRGFLDFQSRKQQAIA